MSNKDMKIFVHIVKIIMHQCLLVPVSAMLLELILILCICPYRGVTSIFKPC